MERLFPVQCKKRFDIFVNCQLSMEDKIIPEEVIQYVMTAPDHEFAGFSVSKLAHCFEIDRFKLSRWFKKEIGMTPDEFLQREKMSRAVFLLIDRGMPVKDVSREIGFCTSDYFIRVFRDYFGVVPGKYKEFKTKRSQVESRRKRRKDRRKSLVRSKIPKSGDRRKKIQDRRVGLKDRRKTSPTKAKTQEPSNGNGRGNSSDD
ncbi:MAG: helix-turn-helix transcriptional regulator [bacterium]|nr:helix-turn-helix transcriptional regulator [bacterium]